MLGWHFSNYIPPSDENPFERLLKVFQEVMVHTSGNFNEALSWMTEIDRQYDLTTDDYGIADFIQDLKDKGWLMEDEREIQPTTKMERALRKNALEEIFDQLKKSGKGQHTTNFSGQGDEKTSEL